MRSSNHEGVIKPTGWITTISLATRKRACYSDQIREGEETSAWPGAVMSNSMIIRFTSSQMVRAGDDKLLWICDFISRVKSSTYIFRESVCS